MNYTWEANKTGFHFQYNNRNHAIPRNVTMIYTPAMVTITVISGTLSIGQQNYSYKFTEGHHLHNVHCNKNSIDCLCSLWVTNTDVRNNQLYGIVSI